MAANSTGLIFEREILTGARKMGVHIRKLPVSQFENANGKRIMVESAYDFFAVYDGIPVAIECKASRVRGSFPLGRVPPHQRKALLEVRDAGGLSYVLLCQGTRTKKVAYVISIENLIEYDLKGKSIPVSELDKLPRLQRITGGWDIRTLFRRM